MKIEITKTPGGIPAISSLEIAKITGKPHGNVMNDIRRILDEAEISQQEFLLSRLDGRGKEQPYFLLPKRECNLVISGYSVKYRLSIIDRLEEAETRLATPAPRVMTTEQKIVALMSELLDADRAEVLRAIFPQDNYGEVAPNGLPKTGFRASCFVAANANQKTAELIAEKTERRRLMLDAIDLFSGQLRLAL